MFIRKYNITVFIHIGVVILLISCVSSQRRWAGNYNHYTQPPLNPPVEVHTEKNAQFDYDKPDNEGTSHHKPETPYHPGNRGDDGREDEQSRPSFIDARKHDQDERDPFAGGGDDDRRDETRDGHRNPPVNVNNERSDGRDPNLREDSFSNPSSTGRDDRSGNRRIVVISQVPKETVPKRGGDDDRRDIRKDLPDVEYRRSDETFPNVGKGSVAVQGTKRPAIIENERKNRPTAESDRTVFTTNRNYGKDSRHENDRKDSSDFPNRRIIGDEKKDDPSDHSLSNRENYRPNRGPDINSRPVVETQPKYDEPPITERAYDAPQFRARTRNQDGLPPESRQRGDGRRYGTPANSRPSIPEVSENKSPSSRNPSRIHPVKDTPAIRPLQHDTSGTPRETKTDGRRYGTLANSGRSIPEIPEEKDRSPSRNPARIHPEVRPLQHDTSGTPRGTKVDGRRYGPPATSLGRSIPENKDRPPSRNSPRIHPVKDIPAIRPLRDDNPRTRGGTKMDDRRQEKRVGFHPDVSYDIIVFPKDEEDERYRQEGSSQRTPLGYEKRDPFRTKRDADLPEDVEILPGFSSITARKEVLKTHEDEVMEDEVDVFSPIEIKINRPS